MLGQGGGAALEEHLVATVQHSLGLYLFDNACFLAERLVAQFPSEVHPECCRQLTQAADRHCRQLQLLPLPACPLCAVVLPVLIPPLAPPPSTGQPLPAGHMLHPLQPVLPRLPRAQGPARRAEPLSVCALRHAAGQADRGGNGAAARQRCLTGERGWQPCCRRLCKPSVGRRAPVGDGRGGEEAAHPHACSLWLSVAARLPACAPTS